MFLSKNHDQHKISKNIEYILKNNVILKFKIWIKQDKRDCKFFTLLQSHHQTEWICVMTYFSEYVSIFFEMFLWYNTFFTNSYQMMVKQGWELTRVDENCLTLGCMNCHREHFKQQNDGHFEHFLTFKTVYVK